MSENSAEFLEAAKDVKEKLTSRPSDEELLELYGFYKQATVGDCNVAQPWFYDIKAKAKWNVWNKVKGMSKEEAEKKYIEIAKELIAKYAQ